MSAKPLVQKQKFTTTFSERGSFWFYGIGMLFYYQIVGSYLNTFLLLRGVDLGKVALIFLGIKIWDAVNDPLFAFIFDRVKFKKENACPGFVLRHFLCRLPPSPYSICPAAGAKPAS